MRMAVGIAGAWLATLTAAAAAGPSHSCAPPPVDALERLQCADPALGGAELRMVQTYYALRQTVGPERQAPLRSEFLRFAVETRALCGLPPVQPGRDQSGIAPPPTAATCVRSRYDEQRGRWAARLSGPAVDEAARDPAANIALQTRLRELTLLPADTVADGVFGTGTRAAILAWQRSAGRPETGFLGDGDAVALGGGVPADPWAKLAVAPLAEAAFDGKPVSATAGDMVARLANGRSTDAALCGMGKGALLPALADAGPDAKTCATVNLVVISAGATLLDAPVTPWGDTPDVGRLQIKVALRRLAPDQVRPVVVLQGYTGGAHCCTATAIVADGKKADLGMMDGDSGYAFLDAAGDGSTALVSVANEFLYRFASYAGSFAPTRIQRFAGGELQDVSHEARFAPFQREQLRTMERNWRDGDHREANGYYGAWVAQKALVGEFAEAWPVMLKNHDRSGTEGLIDCALDLADSKAVKTLGIYACPKGYGRKGGFPEALAVAMVETGYIEPSQAKAVGVDVAALTASRKEAAAMFDGQMERAWFVIDAKGACSLPNPASPADLITSLRGRGREPAVTASETVDGQPVIVAVAQGGARTVFYRGAARCASVREARQTELKKLR